MRRRWHGSGPSTHLCLQIGRDAMLREFHQDAETLWLARVLAGHASSLIAHHGSPELVPTRIDRPAALLLVAVAHNLLIGVLELLGNAHDVESGEETLQSGEVLYLRFWRVDAAELYSVR